MGSNHSTFSSRAISFGRRSSSRRRNEGSSNGASSDASSSSQYASEIRTCDEACRSDPDLRCFGSAVEERTRGAIASVQSDATAAVQSDATASAAVSLRSLRSVTAALLDTNHDAVDLILRCPEDLRADTDLTRLVRDYIENSEKTLDFCVCLNSCLRSVRDQQLVLRVALNCFRNDEGSAMGYKKTLEELGRFREAGVAFTPEFFELFLSVRTQQRTLLENLQTRKRKLDKKLRNVKAWRRISTVIFVSTFSAVLICSVVAAAMAAPPLVTALASAGTVAVGPMGKWFNSLWKGVVDKLEEEKEVVEMMKRGTEVTIGELQSIGALVTNLQGKIEALLSSAEFASRGDEAVKVGVEDIARRMDEFMEGIEGLEKQVETCRKFIVHARTAVLKKITAPGR